MRKEYRKLFHWGGDKFKSITIELSTLPWIALGLNIKDQSITFWLGAYFQIFFSIDTPLIRKICRKTKGETKFLWDLRVHTLSYQIHEDQWGGFKKRDSWRHGFVFYLDKIFGQNDYREETIQVGESKIFMPEKSYDCTYKIFKSYWKRPRSPFTKTRMRIDVQIPEGIGIPGKGENSWDCGDDATFGVTKPYEGSIRDALDEIAISALKTRQRHASLLWKPAEEKT